MRKLIPEDSSKDTKRFVLFFLVWKLQTSVFVCKFSRFHRSDQIIATSHDLGPQKLAKEGK